MELENKYLTYDEYLQIGGTISSLDFQKLEYKAELKVNLHTFNRFKTLETYPNELKMLMFDLIELLQTSDDSYSSETLGNYSITNKTKEERADVELNLFKTYLSNVQVNDVPVLYRG